MRPVPIVERAVLFTLFRFRSCTGWPGICHQANFVNVRPFRHRLHRKVKMATLTSVSTLQEIEAAAEKLPRSQKEDLIAFLAERVGRALPNETQDPFDALIGAFAGPAEATGRRAEEILYGKLA